MPRSRTRRPLSGKDSEIMVLKQVGGLSNVEIAERYGVTEGAIRYRLKRMASGARDGRKDRPSGVSRWADYIAEWVKEYQDRRRRPAITLLHGLLREHHGYMLGYDALRRYMRKYHPSFFKKKYRIRVETPPGVLAQVDWKEKVRVQMGRPGRWVILFCFIFTLCFSRKTVAIWSEDKTQESWLYGHDQALTRLGGLPHCLRPDCLSSAIQKWKGEQSEVSDGYRRYLSPLGIIVFPARPGEAEDKGKVEKKIRDLFAHLDLEHRVYHDLADLQAHTDALLERLSHVWRCGATGLSVAESYAYERDFLRPLPTVFPSYPAEETRCLVRNDGTVFFKGNYHQVDLSYVGKRVLCTFTGGEIVIRLDGTTLGRWRHCPGTKGMVRLQESVLSDPELLLSDTVRAWTIRVARRQVGYYEDVMTRREP